jgi:phage replication-related protein YjqB (UPF0714/DUF867 family)
MRVGIYSSFTQLAGKEPGSFKVERLRRAPFVLVPHGGGIGPGTSEIARTNAGEDWSLYLLAGTKGNGNLDLHVTSTRFNDPPCLELLAVPELVVAVHGRTPAAVFLGGPDTDLGHG